MTLVLVSAGGDLVRRIQWNAETAPRDFRIVRTALLKFNGVEAAFPHPPTSAEDYEVFNFVYKRGDVAYYCDAPGAQAWFAASEITHEMLVRGGHHALMAVMDEIDRDILYTFQGENIRTLSLHVQDSPPGCTRFIALGIGVPK